MALISVREYARQRGVTHPAILKRIKSGKITLVDGKIDPEAADRQWEDSRDEAQVARGAASGKKEPAPLPELRSSSEKKDGTSYADLQRAEKALKIKREQLRLRKEEGTLVSIDEVRQIWSDLVTPAKTKLLAIGAKLAPELAITSDAARCKELVDEAVIEALSEISGHHP